jgi:hypothetical protein
VTYYLTCVLLAEVGRNLKGGGDMIQTHNEKHREPWTA